MGPVLGVSSALRRSPHSLPSIGISFLPSASDEGSVLFVDLIYEDMIIAWVGIYKAQQLMSRGGIHKLAYLWKRETIFRIERLENSVHTIHLLLYFLTKIALEIYLGYVASLMNSLLISLYTFSFKARTFLRWGSFYFVCAGPKKPGCHLHPHVITCKEDCSLRCKPIRCSRIKVNWSYKSIIEGYICICRNKLKI